MEGVASMTAMGDPTAATAAPVIASLETDPEHARATDAIPSSPKKPQSGLSLDPALAAAAQKASTHQRKPSLSLDPKLSPASGANPRSSTDTPPLSLGATTASSTAPASSKTDAPITPPFSPSSMTPIVEKTEGAKPEATQKSEGDDKAELDFEGNVNVNNNIPSQKDLDNVDDLLVLDASGESRPFKALYRGEGVAPRQLIIFIRHFFCGNCQEYLRELSASVSPDALLALEQPTFITVVGCGRPELIDMYAKTTGCPFPIYADPTRKLYDLLHMTRTLDLGKKPEYIQSNILFTSVQSIVQSLKTGSNALKGGDFKQVGGEFLFEDGKCVWAHRMRNTRDHVEVSELRELLGLETKKSPLRKRWSHGVKMLKDQEVRKRSSSWGRGHGKNKGSKDTKEPFSMPPSSSVAENGKDEKDEKVATAV